MRVGAISLLACCFAQCTPSIDEKLLSTASVVQWRGKRAENKSGGERETAPLKLFLSNQARGREKKKAQKKKNETKRLQMKSAIYTDHSLSGAKT